MSGTAYRPEIDGLRAIAVLSVVLFHGRFDGFSGGYVGVDVFFVISGYLITSILLTELAEGRCSLGAFYARRARRILPALFLVMLVSLPAAWLWLTPHALAEFGASVVYTCAFLANVFFLNHADYFDGEMDLKPLAHTWSLAVEEQFYLVFPAWLWLASRLGARALPWLLGGLVAISLGYADHTSALSPQKAFYLLPARMWELLAGALLAWWLRKTDRIRVEHGSAELSSALGLALIAFAVAVFDAETPVPGLAALIPTSGAALVIACAGPATRTGRLLASRPLVAIGLISYSTYLWHQPLFAFYRHATKASLQPGTALTLTAAALALGYLSWRFIETPFRRVSRIPHRIALGAGFATALVLGMSGLVALNTDGFREHYYAHRASDAERTVRALQDHAPAAPRSIDHTVDDGACRFRAGSIDDAFRARFAECARRHGPAVVILGDSHALNVHNALHGSGFGGAFLVGLIRPGCRAENQRALCQYAAFERFAQEQGGAIAHVIYHQSGSYFIADTDGHVDTDASFTSRSAYSVTIDGERPGLLRRLLTSLAPRTSPAHTADRTMVYLDRIAALVPLTWLGPFAESRVHLERPPADGPLRMNPVALEAFAELDRRLTSATAQRRAAWRYVSLLDIVPMDRDFLVQGSCLTFQDRDHLSPCGEALIGAPLARALAPLIGSPP